MPETRVVNFRNEKCDVKITRTPKNEIPEPPNFGWAGNPFAVERYGREKCIELYKDYFYDRIGKDTKFKEAIISLKGKVLGCFCAPLNCHGNIIKDYLDSLVECEYCDNSCEGYSCAQRKADSERFNKIGKEMYGV